MIEERRKQQRHPTEPLDVILLRTPQNVEYLCTVQDLSRTGFRAEIVGGPVGTLPDPDTPMTIDECPDTLADLLCNSTGRVAWTTTQAMGIMLDSDSAEDDSSLRWLLESRNLATWSGWDI